MSLSNEDSLRLNVLIAQKVRAIRIDEGKMIVYALTDKGEAKIKLNQNQRSERYVAEVKDLLSTKALGAPGGFPLYLSRWNRMGDVRNTNLDKLLLLGEPEAVTAVANGKELTAELAASAWWAIQSPENARSMLSNPEVAKADIARELATFLIEFLPFEEEPLYMLLSTRLVLQPDLISEDEKLKLWKKARNKNTLYVGFMDIIPDQLPEPVAEHSAYQQVKERLSKLLEEHNPYAVCLCNILSASGQSFIKTAEAAFKRPPNYDVVVALIESIRRYIFVKHPENGQSLSQYSLGLKLNGEVETNVDNIIQLAQDTYNAENGMTHSEELRAIKCQLPELAPQIQAILILSRISQTVLNHYIAKSSAVGTLMRKKLKPVFDPILIQLRTLQNISLD
jgi:hypothetical protein